MTGGPRGHGHRNAGDHFRSRQTEVERHRAVLDSKSVAGVDAFHRQHLTAHRDRPARAIQRHATASPPTRRIQAMVRNQSAECRGRVRARHARQHLDGGGAVRGAVAPGVRASGPQLHSRAFTIHAARRARPGRAGGHGVRPIDEWPDAVATTHVRGRCGGPSVIAEVPLDGERRTANGATRSTCCTRPRTGRRRSRANSAVRSQKRGWMVVKSARPSV